jgi:hypothetical protein
VTYDWKEVYRQEQKRPGYVIEDGRRPQGGKQEASIKQAEIVLHRKKRKVA